MAIAKHSTYDVSVCDNGDIIGPKGKTLKPRLSNSGYLRVVVYVDGVRKDVSIHRLVADVYVIGIGEQVNHKDGNKLNNNATNLEWVSRSQNAIHAVALGLMTHVHQLGHKWSAGERNGRAKLNWEGVREIRQMYSNGYPRGLQPWLKYGISSAMFRLVIKNINWKELV